MNRREIHVRMGRVMTLLIVGAMLAACKPNPLPKKEAPATGAAATAKTPEKADDAQPPPNSPLSPVVVAVMETGAEPRQLLSVVPDNVDTAVDGEITSKMSTVQNGQAADSLDLKVKFEAVGGLRKQGDNSSWFGIRPMKVTATGGSHAAEALNVDPAKGTETATGFTEVSSNGRHTQLNYSNGYSVAQRPGAAAVVASSWLWIAPVFPSEPVGVGAKWTATQEIPVMVGTARRVLSFEVVSMNDKETRLKITAKDDLLKVDQERMGAGATATYEFTADGDWTVPKGRWPGGGTYRLHQFTDMRGGDVTARSEETTSARYRTGKETPFKAPAPQPQK